MPRNTKPTRIKYTPAQIEQLSEKTVRQRYAQLRKIAEKRRQRLIKAGYKDTDLADTRFKAQSKLTEKGVREGLADLSLYLRDPRSTIKGMKHYVEAMTTALKDAHYDYPARDLKKFGDFMDDLRARYKGRMPGSDIRAGIYDHAARLGVSDKVLMQHFKDWLLDDEKAKKMYKQLKDLELPTHRKRLSSTELKAILEK